MSNQAPQTLKGFRDFLPTEKRKRDFIAATIRKTFETHGFEPVETPTLEYASLLLGKYGTEADKLVYTFADQGDREIGLRYDQTVPTARLLAQYKHLLPKYFRRYQIQNVFRAEKPQKGRFRELTQCDCDIFGTKSPLADAEILTVFYNVYKNIGLNDSQIILNDRQTLVQTLSAFATDQITVFSIIQSIDKLDKIAEDGVIADLITKGLSKEKAIEALDAIQNTDMSQNLETIRNYAVKLGIPEKALIFRPTLARGLDYYTGLIFESQVPDYTAGSLGGGGRYDNLIEQLGGDSTSAVGFAVGFDRTVEIAEQKGLIPSEGATAQVLITIFDKTLAEQSFYIAQLLRNNAIKSEVYPEIADKLGKQLKYANDRQMSFVIIVGPDEAKEGIAVLKNMKSGEEKKGKIEELIKEI
ncbi:histidine--tRNA ligase [soil metagenome]